MSGVTANVKNRHAAHCWLADEEYGLRLAEALQLGVATTVVSLAKMSHTERMEATSCKP